MALARVALDTNILSAIMRRKSSVIPTAGLISESTISSIFPL